MPISKIAPIGRVVELFISKEGYSTRLKQDKISLDLGGIIGDKYHNRDINRSVLLTATYSYDLAKSHNIKFDFGLLGENILINYNPYHLKSGTKLQIGTSIIEINQNCTICSHLSKVDKRLPKLLKNDRGIFVKVVKEGKISLNDEIYLIDE
ncbi:MAG: MOSC domain-containing protein [Sulfurovum sp.]